MENANYPIPDPAWDYFTTWQRLQESKSQIDMLLTKMAGIENATKSSDKLVIEGLTEILQHLQRARDFMPPSIK